MTAAEQVRKHPYDAEFWRRVREARTDWDRRIAAAGELAKRLQEKRDAQ